MADYSKILKALSAVAKEEPAALNLEKKATEQALEKLGGKFKGLYVRPTYEGTIIPGWEKEADLVKGPNQGIASYKSLDWPMNFNYKDIEGKSIHPNDVEPMIIAKDMGNYSELLPEYSPVNKTWVWGNKEERLKKAAEHGPLTEYDKKTNWTKLFPEGTATGNTPIHVVYQKEFGKPAMEVGRFSDIKDAISKTKEIENLGHASYYDTNPEPGIIKHIPYQGMPQEEELNSLKRINSNFDDSKLADQQGLKKVAYDETPNTEDYLSYGIRSAMEDVPAHSNEPLDYETTINKAREIINRWKDDPDYKRMSEMIPQEVKDQKFNDIMNYIKTRK